MFGYIADNDILSIKIKIDISNKICISRYSINSPQK